jgi:LacI family transcriptional regulator
MAQPVSIRDVAARAGVSVATVSNVFNRPGIVARATRVKVERAVADLGYVRNESARQLRSGQSRTIGLIVPDITNPFFTDVTRGVEDVVSAAGGMVVICNSDDDPDKESRYVTLLAEQRVQGVLLVPVSGSLAATARLRDRGIPVVLLDSSGATDDISSVSVNDVAGGRIAVTHLLAGGHRRIALLGAGHDAPQAVDRTAGARQAIRAAGRSPDELILIRTSGLNVEGGARAALEILEQKPRSRPTAVACVNDLLALGLLHELVRNGVRVPEDVAIVGYDDISFAEAAAVPLSSVRQPRQLLGRRAAELLLVECAGDAASHERVVFEPDLVIRASSIRARVRTSRKVVGAAPSRSVPLPPRSSRG